MTDSLANAKCVPCHGGEPAATEAEITELMRKIPNWCKFEVNGADRVERVYLFDNFQAVLDFTNVPVHPLLKSFWGSLLNLVGVQWVC